MVKKIIEQCSKYPIVTWILLLVMIINFILMTFSGGSTNPSVLLEFGAESNILIQQGEWWRLITPIFVHIGYQHLIIDGISIYFVGKILENIFGHIRYFIIFMVSGFCGNLMSFAFENSLSAGSSTSLFGLFGSFLMLACVMKDNEFITQTAKTFLLLIIINLIFDLFAPGINIYGHIGGLIGGFMISFVVGIKGFNNLNKKCSFLYANALIIGIIVLCYIGIIR
ncbi:rhomboid family intramembrane serine protease [Fructilactobacillus lindneri]|nr:rhomboid family intramembrane serine protease [Fructilactobacillus lindneri]ANZ58242.1 rhomboid family intramembrane serine protease [Fructilactobacillus lindneri]ANZ59564.1 rhomboid family intramembrane serine protease [Fructilactobacillus lindneri]SJZ76096.1 rhomboid protease GluP [Fructilactobacillus lindneri DSM 20690 = JCM 11027]